MEEGPPVSPRWPWTAGHLRLTDMCPEPFDKLRTALRRSGRIHRTQCSWMLGACDRAQNPDRETARLWWRLLPMIMVGSDQLLRVAVREHARPLFDPFDSVLADGYRRIAAERRDHEGA